MVFSVPVHPFLVFVQQLCTQLFAILLKLLYQMKRMWHSPSRAPFCRVAPTASFPRVLHFVGYECAELENKVGADESLCSVFHRIRYLFTTLRIYLYPFDTLLLIALAIPRPLSLSDLVRGVWSSLLSLSCSPSPIKYAKPWKLDSWTKEKPPWHQHPWGMLRKEVRTIGEREKELSTNEGAPVTYGRTTAISRLQDAGGQLFTQLCNRVFRLSSSTSFER